MLKPNAKAYCIAQIRNVINKKSTQKDDFLKPPQMQTIQQKIQKAKSKESKEIGCLFRLNSYKYLFSTR